MILKSVIFAWLTIPTLLMMSLGCGPMDSKKNGDSLEESRLIDAKYQADQALSGRCQTSVTFPKHPQTGNNWKLCNLDNPIKQTILARKKKAIEDHGSHTSYPLPSNTSSNDEPKTWLIGRKNSDVQFALAPKSGREYQTQEFWSDESALADTESLAVVDDLRPEKELNLSFGPRLLEKDLVGEQVSIELVKFKDPDAAREILQLWLEKGKIEYFEPNQVHQPMASTIPELAKEYTDADSANLWHRDIRLAETYNALATGALARPSDADIYGKAPVIAVIDSGVDIEHPMLKNAIWENPVQGLLCQNDLHGCNTSVDFNKNTLGDGNVWPAGTSGYNQRCDESVQNCHHGTHVAGIIAGYSADAKIGSCPFCKILPIKVSKSKSGPEGGTILDSSIIRALQYISQFKRGSKDLIRLANASLGKYQRSRSVASLVRKLAGLSGGGVLIIAAASNEDSIQNAYPAALPEAISVAALDENKKKASFSNYGITVDIAAPGTNINSTIPGGNNTRPDNGTSMAAPVVTGVAGLVLTLEPDLDTAALRTRLIETANSYIYSSEVESGYNTEWYRPKISTGENIPLLGSGIVDAYAAVQNNRTQSILVSTKNRIQPGCSQIGHTPLPKHSFLMLALMCLPLISPLIKRKLKIEKA